MSFHIFLEQVRLFGRVSCRGTDPLSFHLQYIQELYGKYEYEEVGSPNIYNFDLWEKSGHAAHYKENMFVFQVEKQEFGLKPMNCPGAPEHLHHHEHLLTH